MENIDASEEGEVCLTYENKKTTAAARSKVGWLTGAVLGEINDEPVLLHTKKKFDLFSANFKKKYFDSEKEGEKKITITFLKLMNNSWKKARGGKRGSNSSRGVVGDQFLSDHLVWRNLDWEVGREKSQLGM